MILSREEKAVSLSCGIAGYNKKTQFLCDWKLPYVLSAASGIVSVEVLFHYCCVPHVRICLSYWTWTFVSMPTGKREWLSQN